jgi:hypothetical protein
VTLPDIWTRLGIPPTTDPAAVRLAYAERLKLVRPDVDPAGFRALREAFEAARRLTSGTPPPRPAPGGAPSRTFRPEPASATHAIRAHLREGRLLEAARAWNRAGALGEISFDEEPILQEEIARAMLAAPSPGFAPLHAAVRLMRWEEAARALGAPSAIIAVMGRHAAEAWLVELRMAADSGWRWNLRARRRNHAARLLLRPAPGRISRWFPYVLSGVNFAHWGGKLALHRPWLEHAIHPARIAWCVAARSRFDARLISIVYRFIVFVFLPLLLGIPVLALVIALLTGH